MKLFQIYRRSRKVREYKTPQAQVLASVCLDFQTVIGLDIPLACLFYE